MTTIPAAVAAALAHVRQFHPEVTQVFFGTDHRWLYCSEAFEAPTFGTGIDVSILEAAADAVTLVPAAFTLEVGATPDHHDSDGTDYAHPAFWRGNDYALQVMVGKIEEILDGKDKGEGTANDPWETARRRMIHLVQKRPELAVWEGPMPESNGRQNYTAVLYRKGAKGFDIFGDGYQFQRSEYPDRTRYEADFMRWLIGERDTKPELWDACYDMEKRSDYIPLPKPPTQRETDLLSALIKLLENDRPLSGNPTHAQLVEYWEYEKTQGRGEADDQLFALSLVKGAYRG